jgi:hypothetical protein
MVLVVVVGCGLAIRVLARRLGATQSLVPDESPDS